MGSMSIWHWILVLAVGLLLFGGRGKISDLMGDFAKGIKSFKKGMSEDDKTEAEPAKADPMKTIDHQAKPVPPPAARRRKPARRVDARSRLRRLDRRARCTRDRAPLRRCSSMFDIGWGELLLIGIVALIAIGPKELPGVLRTLGQWMAKLRRMASEFQGQFQEAMREAEMAGPEETGRRDDQPGAKLQEFRSGRRGARANLKRRSGRSKAR